MNCLSGDMLRLHPKKCKKCGWKNGCVISAIMPCNVAEAAYDHERRKYRKYGRKSFEYSNWLLENPHIYHCYDDHDDKCPVKQYCSHYMWLNGIPFDFRLEKLERWYLFDNPEAEIYWLLYRETVPVEPSPEHSASIRDIEDAIDDYLETLESKT